MWSLKFKVLNKDSVYTLLTAKYKVTDYLYPVDNYKKNRRIYILGIHTLEGKESEKEKFIRALKKNRKVKEIEVYRDIIVTLIAEEEDFYSLLFAAELYHTSPVYIKDGYEQWNTTSFNRGLLEKIIKKIEKCKHKFPEFTLLGLSKTKTDEIYFPKLRPHLPEKQKKAFELALLEGYYSWPRKVKLIDLAKKMKVSVATFHENLRKAEAKLLPFFAK